MLNTLKSGTVHANDGETWTHYAVFSLAEIVAIHGPTWSDDWKDDVAAELTGWTSFYRGPGRAFGDGPNYKIFGRKVLVPQFCGLDV
jgi:hypothetical protein